MTPNDGMEPVSLCFLFQWDDFYAIILTRVERNQISAAVGHVAANGA
jgi:hypothetical protein